MYLTDHHLQNIKQSTELMIWLEVSIIFQCSKMIWRVRTFGVFVIDMVQLSCAFIGVYRLEHCLVPLHLGCFPICLMVRVLQQQSCLLC